MYYTLGCKNVPKKSYWYLKFWFWLIHFRLDGTNVMRKNSIYGHANSVYGSLSHTLFAHNHIQYNLLVFNFNLLTKLNKNRKMIGRELNFKIDRAPEFFSIVQKLHLLSLWNFPTFIINLLHSLFEKFGSPSQLFS